MGLCMLPVMPIFVCHHLPLSLGWTWTYQSPDIHLQAQCRSHIRAYLGSSRRIPRRWRAADRHHLAVVARGCQYWQVAMCISKWWILYPKWWTLCIKNDEFCGCQSHNGWRRCVFALIFNLMLHSSHHTTSDGVCSIRFYASRAYFHAYFHAYFRFCAYFQPHFASILPCMWVARWPIVVLLY